MWVERYIAMKLTEKRVPEKKNVFYFKEVDLSERQSIFEGGMRVRPFQLTKAHIQAVVEDMVRKATSV